LQLLNSAPSMYQSTCAMVPSVRTTSRRDDDADDGDVMAASRYDFSGYSISSMS
jgi:hypothetical protein